MKLLKLIPNKAKDNLYSLRSFFYHNIITAFIRRLFVRFYVSKKNFDPKKTIIICSGPRSGSTWLMNIFANISEMAVYWEPLHKTRGVVPKKINFDWVPFVPEKDKNKSIFVFFKNILSAKYINDWVILKSNRHIFKKADKLLIKFVRANLLLPWLVKNFEFQHLPILLLRHPIPTCMSQIRAFSAETPFQTFEIQEGYYNISHYKKHELFLKKLNTKLEQAVAVWCIENLYALNHPNSGKKWLVVFYENLLLNPEGEINRISKALEIDIPKKDIKLRKASETDFKGDFKSDPKVQLSKWENKISESEKERIQYIFDYFDLKVYRANNPLVCEKKDN